MMNRPGMGTFGSKALDWFGNLEPKILFATLVLVFAAWGFIEITEQVVHGDTHTIDIWLLAALREPGDPSNPIGPVWVSEIARDITALGGLAVLTFFTAAVSGYLYLERRYRMLAFLLIAVGTGSGISFGLKTLFARPRPDVVPHLAEVYTASFPSGHSLMAAVVYLTLGILLAAILPRRRLKLYVLSLAIILTGLVGLSRVYLGVHYPTDVLAGWAAGLVWALLCWLAGRWLQYRRLLRRAGS
jgi:undecaprenyl-diphosphatase